MAHVHSAGWQPPTNKALKSRPGESMRVGAYAIRFGSANEKDLVGDYFTAATDYGPNCGNGAPTMLNHGQPISKALARFALMSLPAALATKDAGGVFVETILDLDNPFQAAIARLVATKTLRWSSGSASHTLLKNADGEIVRWFPNEFSFTPTPCEFRLPLIREL